MHLLRYVIITWFSIDIFIIKKRLTISERLEVYFIIYFLFILLFQFVIVDGALNEDMIPKPPETEPKPSETEPKPSETEPKRKKGKPKFCLLQLQS